MIIAVNKEPRQVGGGGYHFIRALIESSNKINSKIVFNLLSKDIDAIIIIGMVGKNTFSIKDAIRYKEKHHIPIVIRVNNLDTHAQKNIMSAYLKYNKHVDAGVFVSQWALDYAKQKKLHFKNEYVIRNCTTDCFYSSRVQWNETDPLRIVTHHWSTNNYKGFEVYRQLGQLISSKELKKEFNLCYIGRSQFNLPNFEKKPVLKGSKLVEKLAAQHVYISASKLEAGPYHILEALACGLPVIYGESGGAIAEYVQDCGFCFNAKNLLDSLYTMKNNYNEYYRKVANRNEKEKQRNIAIEYINCLRKL